MTPLKNNVNVMWPRRVCTLIIYTVYYNFYINKTASIRVVMLSLSKHLSIQKPEIQYSFDYHMSIVRTR